MKNNKLYSILPISITAAVFIVGIAVGQFANFSSVLAQVPAKTNQVTTSAANTMVLNGAFLLQGANGNFDQSNSVGYFKTGTGAVSLNGDTAIASGKKFLTSTGIATAVAGVATLNQQAGVVTTDDLTGHDNASNYTITVNNSMVTANSFVFYNIVHGSDSIGNPNCFNSNTFTPGSNGSFQVSIRFMGTLPCVANGNEKVNFLILNPQ